MKPARLALAALIGGQLLLADAAAVEGQRQVAQLSAVPPIPLRKPAQWGAAEGGRGEVWTPAVVAEAKARCAAVLKGLDVTAIPHEPIQEGACGAPAPITLIRLGRDPEVVLSPPAVVTCDMARRLHAWVREDVQPLARKLLGAPIVTIETMSSYSCRNAYGLAKTRLSEHGRANALDIGGFLTANAESARVLADWGPTARALAAEAVQKAAAQKDQATASKPVASAGPETQPAAADPTGTAKSHWTAVIATQVKSMLGLSPLPSNNHGADEAAMLGLVEPSRLGGPKQETRGIGSPDVDRGARRSQFLRQTHTAACRHFGTVLGPEANEAHRNHLHLDLAERSRSNFCE
ncbi:MAG TPA: extensin family protein [Hyphomicrobiaceae bacterium]|nr:extensin family protein [Hyphomicrobiaceae bacterium]